MDPPTVSRTLPDPCPVTSPDPSHVTSPEPEVLIVGESGRHLVSPIYSERLVALLKKEDRREGEGLEAREEERGDEEEGSTLVIDARSFIAYNTAHIRTAVNAYYPPPSILRRRRNAPPAIGGLSGSSEAGTGSLLSLDKIVGDEGIVRGVVEGRYGKLVVYDEGGDGMGRGEERGRLTVPDSTSTASTVNEPNQSLITSGSSSSEIYSSHLRLVLSSLYHSLSEAQHEKIHYLKGGFAQFSARCSSDLITRIITDPTPSTPLDRSTTSSAGLAFKTLGDDIGEGRGGGWGSGAPTSADTVRCHTSKDIGDPVEVLPWLYIGNAYHATQLQRLSVIGISYLLNVAEPTDSTGFTPAPSPGHASLLTKPTSTGHSSVMTTPTFSYFNLPIVDSATSDIAAKFPTAIEFIDGVRESGGRVLVHCLAGISRSATICMAYLMHSRELSMNEAHDYLKQRRPLISPNLNFLRQLAEFETKLCVTRRACNNNNDTTTTATTTTITTTTTTTATSTITTADETTAIDRTAAINPAKKTATNTTATTTMDTPTSMGICAITATTTVDTPTTSTTELITTTIEQDLTSMKLNESIAITLGLIT